MVFPQFRDYFRVLSLALVRAARGQDRVSVFSQVRGHRPRLVTKLVTGKLALVVIARGMLASDRPGREHEIASAAALPEPQDGRRERPPPCRGRMACTAVDA